MPRKKARTFDTKVKAKARPLPADGYPITKLGIKLFGKAQVDAWRERLVRHYRNDPVAYDPNERWLRAEHDLTADDGGAILLEWAIEETLRGVLGTRKGTSRGLPIRERDLTCYTYSRADLVLEAPGKAVTSFRGEKVEHEVDGMIGIDCTVQEPGGGFFKKVRCRFVSHPFWQLGVSVAPGGGLGDDDDEDDADLDADEESQDGDDN